MDSKKKIQFSEGKTVIEIGKGEESMALGDEKEIPPLGASTNFELKLVRCSIQSTDDHVVSLSTVLYSQECTTDNLLATRDEGKLIQYYRIMFYTCITVQESVAEKLDLSRKLPSFDETLAKVQKDADSKESCTLKLDMCM